MIVAVAAARRCASVAVAAIVVTACGTTYVDSSATDRASDAAPTTAAAPVDDRTPVEELLPEIKTLMRDLDERIIDRNDETATMSRIDELWRVAERQIRRRDPNDVFNFEQAVDLARSGVTRRRPADASKGYKIIVDVIDEYLARLDETPVESSSAAQSTGTLA